MFCKGKTSVNYREGRGDRRHCIFDERGNPLYVCKKSEVKDLFDDYFWMCCDLWKKFHAGLGLPDNMGWGAYDPDIIDTVVEMEMHYQNNFSLQYVTVLYLESIIKRMDKYAKAIFGSKKKRR